MTVANCGNIYLWRPWFTNTSGMPTDTYVLHKCWTLHFASWAILMCPDTFSKNINFDLEKEEERKGSLNIYFKPLNETNIRHSEGTLFRGVEYFGNISFNISRQRVSKLTSQKAVSLVYLQPFLIHREIYPGFLEPFILHRISIKTFASIDLFWKIRNSFTLELKSVIKRKTEVFQIKFHSFECEISWGSDLNCPGCCLLFSECSWEAIFWYDRRSFWASSPPLLPGRAFEIGRVYIVVSHV